MSEGRRNLRERFRKKRGQELGENDIIETVARRRNREHFVILHNI